MDLTCVATAVAVKTVSGEEASLVAVTSL
jgi:hypothetical protein